MRVETITRNVRSVSTGGTLNMFLSFCEENFLSERGSSSTFREGALSLNKSILERTLRRSAIRSAAELLGAQTKIFADGWVEWICRIASTIVTVFPVPGLIMELLTYTVRSHRGLRAKDNKWRTSWRKLLDSGHSFQLWRVLHYQLVIQPKPFPHSLLWGSKLFRKLRVREKHSSRMKHGIQSLMLTSKR